MTSLLASELKPALLFTIQLIFGTRKQATGPPQVGASHVSRPTDTMWIKLSATPCVANAQLEWPREDKLNYAQHCLTTSARSGACSQ
jgi:hypothetical protein